MLQTRSLRFRYPGSDPLIFPDLEASPGHPLLVLGQSGTGKTTLLHLLGGLLRPADGSIHVAGLDLASLSGRLLDRFRGQNIGLVFQRAHFVEALSVRQNLELAVSLAGKDPDRAWMNSLLTRLGMADKSARSTRTLSAGEQQRLAIARALVNRPDLLLADEPTSALDDHNCDSVLALLREAADLSGATLVIVTHDNRLKSQFDRHIHLA